MDEHELEVDPLVQFERWLEEATAASSPADAMTLATADADGRPSARQVLLRGLDERGFVFFTNLESRKAGELRRNPLAALLFHWSELGRQVRVEGRVELVSPGETLAYWQTRPRESRISAWASPQSRPVPSREALDRLYDEAEARLGGGELALPPFWGGYRVVPEAIEFWQHREHRLHDRIRYVREDGAWRRERLAP